MDPSKATLRRRMRRVRGDLSADALADASVRITPRVLALPEVGAARSVLCYLSVRREIGTAHLVAQLRDRGVQVAVPRIVGPGVMEARLLDGTPLIPGDYGIPTSDGPPVARVDVCLCPGLAFDAAGGRLGYGGGYYDRWLAGGTTTAVALCLDDALIPEVPTESSDHRMDRIVTPTRTVTAGALRVVAAVWHRDGRLLAALRPPGPRGGCWELPGGKVEAHETDQDALARELWEELQVRVTVADAPIAQAVHVYDDVTIELVAYAVASGDPPRAREHEALRWLSPDALWEVPWSPADVPLVEKISSVSRS